MDEIKFLKSFFKDKKDNHAISSIAESIQRVKESSDKEDTKSYIRGLFSMVAHFWYIKNTKKTWEELYDSGYLSYDVYAWSDGLTGDEWDNFEEDKRIIYCIENAIMEADFYLEQEYKGRLL